VVALDDALEVLDLLISEIIGTAKRRVQKNRIRTLKDLDKSALTLAEVCELILNDETNNDALRDEIFTKISKEKLLGYQFSPRLADAGEATFYRIDKSADYGVLNELAASIGNINRIEQHWDDMMRVASSLKLGTVRASELIRSLLKSDKPSNLAKAIIDAGRINKTLYLLNYINDEDYRRRILTQLNRGEERR
jgi:hypothetical protein